MQRAADIRPAWAACFSFAAAAAVFWLPWHVAVPPSISLSYLFGFNNRVAMAAVALCAGLVALLGRSLLPAPAVAPPWKKPLSRSSLLKALLITLAVSLWLFFLLHRLDGWNESIYTVHRVRLLLGGRRPYRDFEFAYGPLLLYGPAFLVRLTGTSVPNAVLAFWLLVNLLSVWQLYTVLCWTEAAASPRRPVFLLLFPLALLCMTSTGTSYSLLRFLTPGFLAMGLQRIVTSTRAGRTRAASYLLVVPGVLLTVGISPEGGLAFTLGALAWLLLFGHLRKPVYLLSFAGAVAGAAGVLLLARHWDVFATMASFRDGGSNYPVLPAPHLLLFLIAIAVSAAYTGLRLRAREGTPLLALCLVAFAQLPAALGRCDVTHVWMNGIGFFVCAMLLCGSARGAARHFTAAVGLCVLLLPVLQGFRGFVSGITDPVIALCVQPSNAAHHPAWAALATRASLFLHGPAKGAARAGNLSQLRRQDEVLDIPALFGQPPGTVFLAPFGFFGGHTAPLEGPAIAPQYFLSTTNMAVPRDVQRAVAELTAHARSPMLLPPEALSSCTKPPEAATAEVRALFFFPFRARPAHPGDTLEPLCSYIRSRYVLSLPATATQRGYEMWLPAFSLPPIALLTRIAPQPR